MPRQVSAAVFFSPFPVHPPMPSVPSHLFDPYQIPLLASCAVRFASFAWPKFDAIGHEMIYVRVALSSSDRERLEPRTTTGNAV